MAHGLPDWGLVGPKTTTYGLDDMGELAVRLGSPDLFDRRGDVVALTDFRDGLGALEWVGAGPGAKVKLVTSMGRQGAYCVSLQAGLNAGGWAAIYESFPIQRVCALGFEFSFSVQMNTAAIRNFVRWFDGANQYTGLVGYDHVAQNLWYRDAEGAAIVFAPNVLLNESGEPEHTVKLVVDMLDQQYVRVMLDSSVYDLKGIGLWKVANSSSPHMTVWALHDGDGSVNVESYVDNVIVTRNEP